MSDSVIDVSVALDGARLIVVGGTGFLGKVWLAQILHRYPGIGKIFLVVRSKKGMDSSTRFWTETAPSGPFDALRAARPGADFENFLREKVVAIDADVGRVRCGISDQWIKEHAGTIDALVNVAGVVDFNPPLDEGVLTNARGMEHLVEWAKALGNVPMLHTSTAYVAGYRKGKIPEVDPKELPFPKCDELDAARWNPANEIAESLALADDTVRRAKEAHKQTEFDELAREALEKKGEPITGPVFDAEREKIQKRWLETTLSEVGADRAKYWGFTNVYTYTKSLGEQVLSNSGLKFTLVRPTVIESSNSYPFPGWTEGINTMAPLIYLSMKGHIQIPHGEKTALDVIPVDMVSAGMTAALAALLLDKHKAVYHIGSSDTNALWMSRLIELVGLYKRKHYLRTGKGNPFLNYVNARFEPVGITEKLYNSQGAPAIASAAKSFSGLLKKAAIGPLATFAKTAAKAVDSYSEIARRNGEIWSLYIPFMAETEYEFRCDNMRELFANLTDADRQALDYSPEQLDWRTYLHEVQFPALEKWVFGEIDEKLKKPLKALRAYTSLRHMLSDRVALTPHATALQRFEKDGLASLTYQELANRVDSTAARLQSFGVEPGDRVALSAKNHPSWVIAYFAIVRAGAVVVPVDPGLDAEPFATVIAQSKSKVLLWDPETQAKRDTAVREKCAGLIIADLFATTEEVLGLVVKDVPEPQPADLASIIYTSGTTGTPRGVLLTHGNFCSLVASLSPVFPLTERDRAVSVLPLHHTFEFTCGLLLPLSRGARIVYLDELNSDRLGEAMKTVRVTAMVGVPALWQLLERRIHSKVAERGDFAKSMFDSLLDGNRFLGDKLGADLGKALFGQVHDELGGSVKFLISGGAALPKDTARLFQGLGLHLSEGYGLTEAAPVLTVHRAGPGAPVGMVGKPVPDVEVRIATPDASGIGEVLARGPNVMLGYADDAEATAKAIDADGWLHTGDLGRIDRKGRLEIVGRNKDVIVNASGENVYPDDVERAVGDIDHVREWCLVGISDGRGGERVACVAVPELAKEGESEDRVQRIDSARKSLDRAFAKLPMNQQPAIVFVHEADLPRTATRKVQRAKVKELAERLASARAVAQSNRGSSRTKNGSGAQSQSTAVRAAIQKIVRKEGLVLTPNTRFREDLGFDSLMAMELATALDAIAGTQGVTEQLLRSETVGALEDALGIQSQVSAATALALSKSSQSSRTNGVEAEDGEQDSEERPMPEALKKLGRAAGAIVQREFYGSVLKVKVTGRAFVPHNRSTLVVSNHSSHLDMGLVKYALGSYGTDLVALAAKDYFFEGNRVRSLFVENFTNLVSLDRNAGLRQTMRAVGDLIESGKTVLIFPEGTRSTDGAIRPFKGAVGHLARKHQVDILPLYLGGTFEALPKGAVWLRTRSATARIGLPLESQEIERLCKDLGPVDSARRVARIAQRAVELLKEGKVLDLRTVERWEDEDGPKEHPLVTLFGELNSKFKPGSVSDPVSFYFTLGNEPEAKWTVNVTPQSCELKQGKPESGTADCVLKTTPDLFTKIVREGYIPDPSEFVAGLIKSNDVSLLFTFQKIFGLVAE